MHTLSANLSIFLCITTTITVIVLHASKDICIIWNLIYVELKKKDVDVITIPDGVTGVVHEPKLKVDLTKYLENHEFRWNLYIDMYVLGILMDN